METVMLFWPGKKQIVSSLLRFWLTIMEFGCSEKATGELVAWASQDKPHSSGEKGTEKENGQALACIVCVD